MYTLRAKLHFRGGFILNPMGGLQRFQQGSDGESCSNKGKNEIRETGSEIFKTLNQWVVTDQGKGKEERTCETFRKNSAELNGGLRH